MKNLIFDLSAIIILSIASFSELSAQNYAEIWARDSRAFIVVTGMKINTENGNYAVEDLSVAEGAIVKVSEKNGSTWEKKTEAFSRPFGVGGTFYSADFPVIMDSVYTITITFKSGTVITIDDYKLPSSWKTHHYFHSTDGTKSTASVLRKEPDKESGLWCFVYSLYPLSNYITSGGTQVK